MNLFKVKPLRVFELIAALILVGLAYMFFVYFDGLDQRDKSDKDLVTPPSVKKDDKYVDYASFGAVHMSVGAPSLARSNFDVDPRTAVTVYFNEKVDVDTLLDRFTLLNKNNGRVSEYTVDSVLRTNVDNQDNYTWKWQEVWQQKVIFTPSRDLENGTAYRASVSPGFKDESGSLTASNALVFDFLTANIPGFINDNVDNESGVLSAEDDLIMRFKSPMDRFEFVDKLTISPAIDVSVTVHDKTVTIKNAFEKDVDYKLNVSSVVRDLYGRALGKDIELEFVVR